MAPKTRKSKPVDEPAKIVPLTDDDLNAAFTPERFERELQSLAAKAKEETWGKHLKEQGSVYLKTITLLSLIAVYSNVSQLALSPVYGAIPSSLYHSKLVAAACFTGWASTPFLGHNLPLKPQLLLPLVALYIPAIQFFLYKFSETLGATWGPVLTEGFTLFPLTALSAACVGMYLDSADLSSLPKMVAEAAPGMGSYGFFKAMEKVAGLLIGPHIGKTFLNTRLGLELLLAASYSLYAPSKFLLYATPALLHTAVLNTHVQTPMALSALNSTLTSEGWSLLDRRESLTGYISVIESVEQGFRVMRCDHSLLGGEWVKFQGDEKFKNNKVAEPIYGVFAMLEAVRLVQVPKPVPDHKASALVIGLGIGTTPAALVAHGIDTTVVEIDPVVHEFALKWFQLPKDHTAVLDDAVGYAAKTAKDVDGQRYDYIVHDVFTGGAEPVDLFTLEFLQNLSGMLKPGGVIAINYAGDFTLPPPRVVVQTIREVFPSCRIFREHPRDEAEVEANGRDFTNMVVFCTKLDRPVTFRQPNRRDLLNSPSRDAFLVPQHEVTEDHFLAGQDQGILRQNDTQKLAKWHETSAVGHWNVMRTVLPSTVWVNW